jgi:hypothetical protein
MVGLTIATDAAPSSPRAAGQRPDRQVARADGGAAVGRDADMSVLLWFSPNRVVAMSAILASRQANYRPLASQLAPNKYRE